LEGARMRLSTNQIRADPPENHIIDFRYRDITGARATHHCWLLKIPTRNAARRLRNGLPSRPEKKASSSNTARMSNATH
jgi:hypothetical protein